MDGLYRNVRVRIAAAILLCASSGCQMAAPIHVWTPPQLKSAVGHKVAIAPIAGDPKIAGPLHTAMIAHAPRDNGRVLHCVDMRSLRDDRTIRLVSAIEGETSDIADLSMARRQGIDFLLSGEIIRQPSQSRKLLHQTQQSGDAPVASVQQEAESLAVSWKLVDVRDQGATTGTPIVSHHVAGLDEQAMAEVAAELAWKLITPHVSTEFVNLSVPRVSPGSSLVRRGNAAAAEGDWMSAQETWQRVLVEHPKHHAALHNLAIAAVARQDYDDARRFIGTALQLSNRTLYKQTAVWIETSEREYREAFGLPPPESGWAATRR